MNNTHLPDEPVQIETATEADLPLVLSFIKGLAEYTHEQDHVVATEEALREGLFGPRPYAEVLIARFNSQPAGFALFFHNFSTFLARPGIYLEDLFVLPEYRSQGIGRVLLIYLARLAIERKCGRFEWMVLDWNEPAIRFYQRLGAVPLSDLTTFRLAGDALEKLAKGDI